MVKSSQKNDTNEKQSITNSISFTVGLSLITLLAGIVGGYWWGEFNQMNKPQQLGTVRRVGQFDIKVDDFSCARAVKKDDILTEEKEEGELDFQRCTADISGFNASNKSNNLYSEPVLYVSEDEYRNEENNFPLGTGDVFPKQKKSGKLYFEIPLGDVPTYLEVNDPKITSLNPFNVENIKYDLR